MAVSWTCARTAALGRVRSRRTRDHGRPRHEWVDALRRRHAAADDREPERRRLPRPRDRLVPPVGGGYRDDGGGPERRVGCRARRRLADARPPRPRLAPARLETALDDAAAD